MKRVVKCYGCGRIVRTSCAYVVYYTGGSLKDKRKEICPRCYSDAGFVVTSKAKRKAFGLDPLYPATASGLNTIEDVRVSHDELRTAFGGVVDKAIGFEEDTHG